MEIKKTPLCACGCRRLVRWNRSKWRWSIYLSGHNRIGKFHSEKTKREMRERRHSEETKREMRGFRLPRETRTCKCGCGQTFECKINNNKKYIRRHRPCKGEDSPNWRGGISFTLYPSDFNEQMKQTIRERDGYICQLCWESEEQNRRKLDVHHIDHNKDNCYISNLISLCSSCNSRVNAKILKDAWIRFFQRLIGENQLKTSIIGI